MRSSKRMPMPIRQVAFLHRVVGGCLAVHAAHPHGQGMALGDHADAQQGRDHGDLGLLGQLEELTLGMAHLYAVRRQG